MKDKQRICKKCTISKDIEDFYFRNDTGKHRSTCKKCNKNYINMWQKANVIKVKKYKRSWRDKNLEYNNKYRANNLNIIRINEKEYYEINKIEISRKAKIYRDKNSDKIKIRKKEYYEKNKHELNKRQLYKRQNNVQLRIKHSLRNRIRLALKNNQKFGSAIKSLGCSVEELKLHLEKQFYPNPKTMEQMTWDNWSLLGWHIDHIKPLSSFDLTDEKQFLQACHYTNLQPLWSKENISKGANIQ